MSELFVPVKLSATDSSLVVEWNDGVRHVVAWSELRRNCPCATCRDERMQPLAPATLLPVITPEEARPIRATAVNPVGNYAYSIHFSDGHNTGIFQFPLLRDLGAPAE